jgi:sialate O-acetylesterase
MKNNLIEFVLFLIFYNSAFANVTLPNVFSDNMVLQRNTEITIWGWANPKEEVKITPSWNNQEYKVVADNHAYWTIKIPTPKEGGPYTILLKGYNEISLKNILIGEVWLCSGQSNMEMNANWGIINGEEEAKKAINSNIRFFSVEKASAETPQNNLSGNWVECSPETMKMNSAVAYFFAQRITEDLRNVPIGMIISAWGATPAEVWIPENVIQNNKELLEASKKLNPNEYSPIEVARTYNSMIHPLIGFKIAGVLWYQGESNVGSSVYDKTFASLITSWRKLWKQDFPF